MEPLELDVESESLSESLESLLEDELAELDESWLLLLLDEEELELEDVFRDRFLTGDFERSVSLLKILRNWF